MRELLLGPKRFTDLRAGLPQVGPDVLSQRLRELEAAGLVQRRSLDPPAPARVYELTGARRAARARDPRARPLRQRRARSPRATPTFGPDALALALKTLYEPGGAPAQRRAAARRPGLPRERRRPRSTLERGSAEHPDASIEAEPGPLAAVLWHGRDLAGAERAGEIAISGSRRAATRFLKRFPLP